MMSLDSDFAHKIGHKMAIYNQKSMPIYYTYMTFQIC